MEKNKLMEQLTIATELTTEPYPGQTLVELFGTERVIIENHKGICQYSDTKICIKTRYGCLSVLGAKLHIIRMSKERLIICGQICEITAERKGKR